MPRAIVYGRRNPADEHFKALVADQPGRPSPELRQELHAKADELAALVAPEAVQPHYLARIALEADALRSPDKANYWSQAAKDAAAGEPLPAGAEALAKTAEIPEPSRSDGFLEKIAKYVPAESITLTTLAFAALTPTGSDVWWLVAAGAAANVLYLFGTALQSRKETKEMPRWFFYPLSALALALWSLAVIGVVGSEFGIGGSNAQAQKTFALAFAAFLVPLLDTVASGLTDMYEEKHPPTPSESNA
jgi:hypothetical protein